MSRIQISLQKNSAFLCSQIHGPLLEKPTTKNPSTLPQTPQAAQEKHQHPSFLQKNPTNQPTKNQRGQASFPTALQNGSKGFFFPFFSSKLDKNNLLSLLVLIAWFIFFSSAAISFPCLYFEVFLIDLYHFCTHLLIFQRLLQESFSLSHCTQINRKGFLQHFGTFQPINSVGCLK